MPHITFAAIDGKASNVTPRAVSCAASTAPNGCNTPNGNVPAKTGLMNFPVSIQTSVTYGLRYDINDSAALKVEYSVVDVENVSNGINFGLFDTSFSGSAPTEKVGVTSLALDVIF